MAAQFTATKGLSLRSDFWCRWRAITSLPVPLSPVTRTGASERAICEASWTTRSIAGSRQIRLVWSAATASSTAAISSGSGGSGTYSRAPAWIAATAARASVEVPQATIGVRMRSASSAATNLRDRQRDIDHQQVGALGAQHRQRLVEAFGMGHVRAVGDGDLGGRDELALETADNDEAHGSGLSA